MDSPAEILIVDDTPDTRRALELILRNNGYRMRQASSGQHALDEVAAHPPDLILMDINMPGMDGMEAASRLKENPATADIPIIFISVRSEATDKVKAFGTGGVDYVTKPFYAEEVISRIAVHLTMSRQRIELKENYDRIHQLEIIREKLTRLIVHDMSSPLNAIHMHLEIMGKHLADSSAEARKSLRRGLAATDNLIDMTKSLLDMARLRQGGLPLKIVTADLADLARETVAEASVQCGDRTVTVENPTEKVLVRVDTSLLRRVIRNILDNAIKFTDSRTGRIILRETIAADGRRIIAIEDNGPGIPEEYRSKIFEEFWQIEGTSVQGVHSTGLGLNFCKLAVEAHGGRIVVREAPGHGSIFEIALPEAPPSAKGARGATA
jgi:two-component system sensor histidine kinase/response regulator